MTYDSYCQFCGGDLEIRTVDGATREYLPGMVITLSGTQEFPRCIDCGEVNPAHEDANAFEAVVAIALAKYCKSLMEQIESTGCSLSELESTTGFTHTYLTHVANGTKTPSLRVIQMLQLMLKS